MTQANASQTGNGAATAAPAPSTAEPSALDNALREFESGTAQPQALDALRAFQPVIEYAKSEMEAKQTAAETADVSSAVKSVKVDLKLDDKFPDRLVRGYLHDLANSDEAFREAWANRAKAPEVWKAKLKAGTESFAEVVKELPGNSVRTDIEAAAAAVRGTSHSPANGADEFTPTQMMQMSDRDWENYKARELAKAG